MNWGAVGKKSRWIHRAVKRTLKFLHNLLFILLNAMPKELIFSIHKVYSPEFLLSSSRRGPPPLLPLPVLSLLHLHPHPPLLLPPLPHILQVDQLHLLLPLHHLHLHLLEYFKRWANVWANIFALAPQILKPMGRKYLRVIFFLRFLFYNIPIYYLRNTVSKH